MLKMYNSGYKYKQCGYFRYCEAEIFNYDVEMYSSYISLYSRIPEDGNLSLKSIGGSHINIICNFT
jgi:hypothetical protein